MHSRERGRKSREQGAYAFLSQIDPQASMVALDQDASNRRYYRVSGAKHPSLLMDCPPGVERLGQFIHVASFLSELGLAVPNVYEFDEESGYALIEDLGTNTFTRLLGQSADQDDDVAEILYRMAVDTLVCIHKQVDDVPGSFPDYLAEKMADAACLMLDWYIPAITNEAVSEDTRLDYREAWLDVLSSASEHTTLVLRDYHVDNLLLCDGKQGVARCGVIDFQDAARGPRLYDLVSLLEDARRVVSPELKLAMQAYYAQQMGTKLNDEFEAQFASLAAQRHSRVAGVFVRLAKRDGRTHYLDHLPLVVSLMASAFEHPNLERPKAILDTLCPTWRGSQPLLKR
ncbi:MAG: phosphotransferase [Proteobacteria bacterium]|jgi:N-acetylmuramate 1-kinase|nr:phosphotransferase [Pseudomonadota bacterium]